MKEGTKNGMVFVEEILLKNNFRKEDMKTRNFVIREETKYNNRTGKDASGKRLKYCEKVDFKPFTTNYVSQASIGSEMMYAEKLYCLWIAE